MTSDKFLEICKEKVMEYENSQLDENSQKLDEKDILLVWFSKTLKHYKALFITTLFNKKYFECTFNGDKQELYFDAYSKVENRFFDFSFDGEI